MTRSVYGTTENGMKIHILLSSGHYFAQVRGRGYRKYVMVGKAKTLERAIARAAANMKGNHRLRVIFEDSNPYYEPHIVFEGICK